MAEAGRHLEEEATRRVSPWPIVTALGAFLMMMGAYAFMRYLAGRPMLIAGIDLARPWPLPIGFAVMVYAVSGWWTAFIQSDAQMEPSVRIFQIRQGAVMFLVSEALFLLVWFWAFFAQDLFPGETLASSYAAFAGSARQRLDLLAPWQLPLLSAIVLLLSASSATWARAALRGGDRAGLVQSLGVTAGLGLLFLVIQIFAYGQSVTALKASLWGVVLFMAIGFFSLHVIAGTGLFLASLARIQGGSSVSRHDRGLQTAISYWYMIVFVWLVLLACLFAWTS